MALVVSIVSFKSLSELISSAPVIPSFSNFFNSEASTVNSLKDIIISLSPGLYFPALVLSP